MHIFVHIHKKHKSFHDEDTCLCVCIAVLGVIAPKHEEHSYPAVANSCLASGPAANCVPTLPLSHPFQ